MNLGISTWLKKLFGGAPPATVAPAAPNRARSSASVSAMTARLARIDAAEAKVSDAQARIDELSTQLEKAKEKEAGAAQTAMAKARTGEDTRQYVAAQQQARDEMIGVANRLASARKDLEAAKAERAKA